MEGLASEYEREAGGKARERMRARGVDEGSLPAAQQVAVALELAHPAEQLVEVFICPGRGGSRTALTVNRA